MSRHNDPMMELLDMIFGGERPNEKQETPCEPPTKTEGFDSLVSDEEYEAVKGVKDALVHFMNVHNKNVLANMTKVAKSSPYAKIQYSLLSDAVNEAQDAVQMMYGIHSLDKQTIDEMASDCNCTVEEFEKKTSLMLLMKKMTK